MDSSFVGGVSSLINQFWKEMVQKGLRESENASLSLRKRQKPSSQSLLQILNLKIDFFYLDSCITCKALGNILLEIVEVSRQLCLI